MQRPVSIFIILLLWAASTATAWEPQQTLGESQALREFLTRFDSVTARGYITTLRPGPTGVGYTLESLLEIAENNSPRGDFQGMEIKAYRDSEDFFDDQSKMNLFLKEPTWRDTSSTAERIRRYGYIGKFDRWSWYQSVTVKPNDAELSLFVDRSKQQVQLRKSDVPIAHWDFETLQKRLQEKLTEIVFVAASTKGQGADERFHYRAVTWCSSPSLSSFLQLIESRDVILELRMHVKDSGAARNHGTAFRLRKHHVRDLFSRCVTCRPTADNR